jgi:hypothetical protein
VFFYTFKDSTTHQHKNKLIDLETYSQGSKVEGYGFVEEIVDLAHDLIS